MVPRVMAGVALAVFGLGLPAQADQWSKTYPVAGKADLLMKTGDGNVRIEVWDRQEIDVRLETVGLTINHDFTLIEGESGGRVSVEAKFPPTSGFNFGGRHSLDFTVKVPREAALEISTGDGNIRIAGVHGHARLHSGDGQIEVSDLDGSLTASSGDGDVHVAGRFDELDIRTGDGDVEAGAAPGSVVASSWRVTTGDGDVTFRLADDLKANLEARTNDGRLTVDVPLTISGSQGRSHATGTLNGGGGTLSIRTGDGGIHIGKY